MSLWSKLSALFRGAAHEGAQTVVDEFAGRAQRVVCGGAGDEPANDVPGERGGRDEPLDLG